jgi:glycosyltransferase involved in cell wall biosynthesis
MPSVDIAIPCYNYGRYLGGCIASIQNQGIEDLRILIVDNASTDDSLAIARSLAAKEPRIEILARQKNLGPHASFNAGVDWAASDYFMVLCADDMLAPGCLANAVAIMEAKGDVVFTIGADVHQVPGQPMPVIDHEPKAGTWRIVQGDAYIEERCSRPEQYIAAGMVLVRTSAQKRAGHYRPELDHTDDLELLLRLARLGQVAVTPAVQGIKRFHATNKTYDFLADRTSDLVERVAAFESFFSHEGASMPDARRLLRLARRSIAERAYWCGVKDLCRGRRSAASLFKLAFSLDPKSVALPPLGYLSRMDRELTPLEAAGVRFERWMAGRPGSAGSS